MSETSEPSDPSDPRPPVTIRPLTRDDFASLQRWFTAPHVRRWWPDEPTTLAGIEREYGPSVDGEVRNQVCTIELDGEPIGIIQCYRHADHPLWDNAVGIPAAAGIDYLIGEADQVGKGLGTAAIVAFTGHVFASYPDVDLIVSTPQGDNPASRRVLEKAGFTFVDERKLDSDDPSDAGPSAIYTLPRPR